LILIFIIVVLVIVAYVMYNKYKAKKNWLIAFVFNTY
jgi:hypothetical protein